MKVQKNIKNGEINTEDADIAFDELLSLVQQQKNKIYDIIYSVIIGDDKTEQP